MNRNTRVCPWWFCPSFDNPLRRLVQPPQRILEGLVQPGMTVLDLGCGMGYFTGTLAHMVGLKGKVIAADLQPQMLVGAARRIRRAGLSERVTFVRSDPGCLNVSGPVDFALAFWMVHEVSDLDTFFGQVAEALHPGAQFLIVEPLGHVSQAAFERSLGRAAQAGFSRVAPRRVALSRAALLVRAAPG